MTGFGRLSPIALVLPPGAVLARAWRAASGGGAVEPNLSHRSVLLKEAAAAALGGGGYGYGDDSGGRIFLDATFGGGGHSRELLQRIAPDSRLFALDCDEWAQAQADKIDDSRFVFLRENFANLRSALARAGIDALDGALFDLGVSSAQLADSERGFSFAAAGPLDMRMDRRESLTLAAFLRAADEGEIRRVLRAFGEEPAATRIARAVAAACARGDIEDTADLARVIAAAKPRRKSPRAIHPATQAFQALRIAVNGELDNARAGLLAAAQLLRPGGRLAVISFHSLEDRLVKRLFAAATYPNFGPAAVDDDSTALRPLGKITRPTESETAANPRARSARLRVFEKTAR